MPSFLLTQDGKRLAPAAYGVLVVLCLLFYLPGFFSLPPIDRDEPHFAQATKQMLETDNYTDIRFQAEPRYKKPVGIYWLQAASVKLFSPEDPGAIWAYRIPSLVGATLAVLFTAALGALFFGPGAGFLAALFLMSCLVLNVEARLAKTDAFLLACIMGAQYALARLYKAHRDGDATFAAKRNAWLFWTAQGLGFLIKGPLPLLFTVSTLLVLWRLDRPAGKSDMGWLKRLYPLPGLVYAAGLAAPWFVAISLMSHGGFVQASAGHDLLGKLWQGQDRGIVPPGLYLLALPVSFFPASLLIGLALPDIWARRREPWFLFCLGWIVPPWILLELALTKLPHYVMPLYPALALLAAAVALDGFPALKEKWSRRWAGFYAGIWFAVGTLLAAAPLALSFAIEGRIPPLLFGLSALFLVLLSFLMVAWTIRRQPLWVAAAFLAAPLLFGWESFGLTLPQLKGFWPTEGIIEAAEASKPCPTLKLAAAGYNEPSLVFRAGTHTEFAPEGAAIAEKMMADSCVLGLLNQKLEAEFRAAFTDPARQPEAVGAFHGFNLGGGRRVDLTLYRLPKNR